MSSLPPIITAASELLRSRNREAWDADDEMEDAYVCSTPLGRLVEAFLSLPKSKTAPLAWLALFAARRALPCWELYCDGSGPLDAVQTAERWLTTGMPLVNVADFARARPSYQGVPIVDCRACDTGAAAESAVQLIRFLRAQHPLNAIYCLSSADTAFDQSPLGEKDHFREWLVDYAIPIAIEAREMTQQEQNALREYDPGQIRRDRECFAAYWNSKS